MAVILSLNDEGSIGVKLVDGDNQVEFQPIDIVASDSEGIWITGLPHEALLITVGHEFVSIGQEVRPIDDVTLKPFARDNPS